MNQLPRRKFLKYSTLASTALALPLSAYSNKAVQVEQTAAFLPLQSNDGDLQVHLFSKVLQFLSVEETCAVAKEMGFDGLDLTVRPKGHVFPEEVVTKLPVFVDSMKQHGLTPLMISSGVSDANSQTDQTVLKTAKSLGFNYYRPAWIKYDAKQDVYPQFEAGKNQLKELSTMSEELGMHASYQNHSGSSLGAAIWDFYQIATEVQSPNLGFQYDITHATIESGRSWATEFELIQPFISTVAVKDFLWKKKDGKWKVEYQPLGEGMVDIKKFFKLLKQHNMNVPMTLHIEYFLGGAEKGKQNPTMEKSQIIDAIKKDLDFIRSLWAKV